MIEQDENVTLPGVTPVELPAPTPSTGRSPSLALRAFVSVGLLVGLFAVAFLLVLGLIGLNILVAQTGRILVALVVVTLAVILSIGRGLLAMIRKPPEPEGETEVPAAEEPELHHRLNELARAVGTRAPDRVVVTPEVNAYVREFGPLMGLMRGRRTLAIGTPLLDVLSVSQLEAVLAHELGHLAGGDTRLGPLAFRTDQATLQMVTSLRGRAIARVFVAYWRFQHRVSATVRRGQELLADRAAVRVAGRQAAADALDRVEIAGRAEAVYRDGYLIPLLEVGCRPADLASGLREILRDPKRVAELRSAASVPEDHDPWATHPPTAERIARLAALADPADVVTDDRPARVLWRDPDRWTRQAQETWLAGISQGQPQFRTVAWDSFGDETAGRVQRDQAADVDRVLGQLGLPPGLDGLRQALTAGRNAEVAGDLIASGWRAPGTDEREAILTVAVVATTIRAALDQRVGQLLFSWSEPLTLADMQGRRIPVGDLARGAVTGDWDPLYAALAPPARRRPLLTRRQPRGDGTTDALHGNQQVEGTKAAAVPAGPVQAGTVPAPPCPPFTPSSGDWLWELKLPSTLGKKNLLAIGADALAFDKAVARYDDIRSVSFKLESEANLTLTVKLGLTSGKTLKLVSGAIGGGGRETIDTGLAYLWSMFRARVGPRLRASIKSEIDAGAEVKVGNLTLARTGITYRAARGRQVPWDQVVDAVIRDGMFHIILASGKTITRPLATENAFVLVDLIPELRARYG